MHQQTCQASGQSFTIPEADAQFYQTIGVELPKLSPRERNRRRLMFRNERSLYHRTCDLTGKKVISFYHPDQTFPVYEKDAWWSDGWDGKDFGRDFDFKRPFFEQFTELRHQVPRMNLFVSHCEKCDYAPYSVYSKHCFMAMSCFRSEDLLYAYQTHHSRDCMEMSLNTECELCYECLYCRNGYQLRYCRYCDNCTNSWFCLDCIGCSDCFGCVNLRHKQYCFLNEQLTKEEYEQKIAALNLHTRSQLDLLPGEFQKFALKFPHRHMHGQNNENVTGDNLYNSKNLTYCFDDKLSEDCGYIYGCPKDMKDCRDMHYSPGSELGYEAMSAVNNYRTRCMLFAWDMKNADYCEECFYSHDLFGCVGLKKAEYCIFNKPYTPQEYQKLRDRIIEHMKKTGEWGFFFPPNHSPFAYNETIAQEHFPLTKEEVLQRGWRWREEEATKQTSVPQELPETIEDVSDSICDKILICQETGRHYSIQRAELRFYQKMNLPLPRVCPQVRYERRMKYRNPWELHRRKCAKTGVEVWTSYAPDRPEIVYSEAAYRAQVH